MVNIDAEDLPDRDRQTGQSGRGRGLRRRVVIEYGLCRSGHAANARPDVRRRLGEG